MIVYTNAGEPVGGKEVCWLGATYTQSLRLKDAAELASLR